MIGWLISIVMLFTGCVHGNNVLVIASGLFAIAGSIGYGLANLGLNIKAKPKKEEPRNLQSPL